MLFTWIIKIAVDDFESALTLRHYFLGACNSPRLTRVRVLVHDEVIETYYVFCAAWHNSK